jgi:hypothetical protein
MDIEKVIPVIRTICQDSGNRGVGGINAGWNCGEQAAILNRCALAVGFASTHHRGAVEVIIKKGREHPYLLVKPHHFCVIDGSIVDPSITIDGSLSPLWEDWNIAGIHNRSAEVLARKVQLLNVNSQPLGEVTLRRSFRNSSYQLLVRYIRESKVVFPFDDHDMLMQSPVSQYLANQATDVEATYDHLVRALELILLGKLSLPHGEREDVCRLLNEQGQS